MVLTDLAFLREFCRNDRQRMAQYVTIFLESVPGMLNELDQGILEDDLKGLKKSVHSLKPQVTFLGLESLKERAEQIEKAIDNSASKSEITAMVSQLKSGLELAADELVETLISLS